MDKYATLFEYFRQCPELNDLWSIAATEDNIGEHNYWFET